MNSKRNELEQIVSEQGYSALTPTQRIRLNDLREGVEEEIEESVEIEDEEDFDDLEDDAI